MRKPQCMDRIAIVEDERELAQLYATFFNDQGYSVCFIASNGQEAVDLFKESVVRPNVIIMDQRMPVMTGTEATRKILMIDPDVKIIFVSADEHTKEESLEAGAVAFIKKPVSIWQIINCVESFLCRKA